MNNRGIQAGFRAPQFRAVEQVCSSPGACGQQKFSAITTELSVMGVTAQVKQRGGRVISLPRPCELQPYGAK
jgi:hypothetical protein